MGDVDTPQRHTGNLQQHTSTDDHRSPGGGAGLTVTDAAAGGGSEVYGEFQHWCLRTYGDSGKTKTVTRRKYNKILQTLLHGDEDNNNNNINSNGAFLHEGEKKHNCNNANAKFKFWVKSKGFQVGTVPVPDGTMDAPVLYVPIKTAVR